MDAAARDALAKFLRGELRTELAAELDLLEELRLRLNAVEAQAGIPTGLPRGAKQRQREVVRLRREGYSLRRIAMALAISRTTVENDLSRAAAVVPSPDGIAADGRTLGGRATPVRRDQNGRFRS